MRLAEQVRALADGEVTSVELVRQSLANPPRGAVEQCATDALAQARRADERRRAGQPLSRLDGVPLAVKANLDVAGLVTTAGTGLRRRPARDDAAAVGRLRSRGLIPVASTTLAEAAVGAVTDNPHTGRCWNPRHDDLQAGGSSGGSAAMVAAGAVSVALGSDTMGSVRIPAAYCGIAGLKPSRRAIDATGLDPLSSWLDTVGVLATSCADLETVLVDGLGRDRARPTGRLRVGVPDLIERSDADGVAAVERAVEVLRRLGHGVRRGPRLDLDPAVVRRGGLLLCEAETYLRHREAVDAADPGLSPGLRRLLEYGGRADPARVESTRRTLEDLASRIDSVVAGVDVLVLPVTPGPVPAYPDDPPEAADLTAWVNVVGLPAVAFPSMPAPERGVPPRGVQLIGRRDTDLALVRLAAEVQDASRR